MNSSLRLNGWLCAGTAYITSLVLAPACCLAYAAQTFAQHTATEVLVVSNGNSPTSTAIAKDYVSRRGVTHRLVIHCADSALSTDDETISLANYTSQIADPVSKYLKQHKGINFVVLTKGLPIRIDGGVTGSRDEHSTGNLHPSVDSYLAAIDYASGNVSNNPSSKEAVKISIHGSGASGYGWLNRYWKATVPFSHEKFGGYLVTRLDGYTEADAEALVTRALAAEKAASSNLKDGKVLFDVQPIFKPGDVESQPVDVTGAITDESDYGTWNADMIKASRLLEARKIPVDLEMSEAFAGNRSNLLGYFSWGSNDPKFTDTLYQSLTFAPGAMETRPSQPARERSCRLLAASR